uniref:RBPJ-interacting and tubulin-associated protein n=1 Tax=Parastrongyloides trichosuri TaxID=131310 RepID=A0A0N5A194_PARTI
MNQWFSNVKNKFMDAFTYKKDEVLPKGTERKGSLKILNQTKKKNILSSSGRIYNSDPQTNPGLASALNKVSRYTNNYYSVPRTVTSSVRFQHTRSTSGDNDKNSVRPRSRTTCSDKGNIFIENNATKKKPKFIPYGKQTITSRKIRTSFNKPKFIKCRSLDLSTMNSVKKGDLNFP